MPSKEVLQPLKYLIRVVNKILQTKVKIYILR